ncbi:FAD-dependent oxidoreductase [Halomonas eurihalina]|uniref:FAD-dependent oxidoreductase n=1 Tax=Halomonas eurihalina TaxID=42566 RepID=A0A5D9CVH3_HALER|nr:FAD-dependent oxidoreductase [Halomonas eurihalina]MDR5861075.1 FAD-dependent oxidoreductase [Halomonas eurihalina]TZG35604.1 FAD-dependent oxidoreductase [Halomonas eurihalina]
MNQATSPSRIAVIGGGVVGMTIALALQRQGHTVSVLDPRGPGEGASYGNAGFLATELIDPLSTLATLRKAPRLWLDPHGALALPLRYLPRLVSWLGRFIAAARPARATKGRQALAALNGVSVAAWKRCLAEIGAEEELLASGYLLVWESTRGRVAAKAQMEHLQRWGYEVEWLEAAEIRAREPGLAGKLSHGLYFPGAHQVRDPHALVRRLAEVFEARGGGLCWTSVSRLEPRDEGVRLHTDAGQRDVDRAVVAAGAWSHYLAESLGLEVPLETERGYHLTLPTRGEALCQPVGSAERHCVMTPMSCGLRVVGFTELGGLTLPPRARRYASLRHHVQALLCDSANLDDGAEEWMGFRPTLPDSLPVIDRHPDHSQIFFAFGHQHLGLTQAAITAELMGALVGERAPAIDLSPYRITRFMNGS